MSTLAAVSDWAMCTMMTLIQRRHRLTPESPAALARYIEQHLPLSRAEYFHSHQPAPEIPPLSALSERVLHPSPATPPTTAAHESPVAQPSPLCVPQASCLRPSSPRSASRTAIRLTWPSPFLTPWPENNHTQIDYYPGPDGPHAPTVLMLHALMSASDLGYRRWAARFNACGWNACFLHLPYHYSRKPARRLNGELAITADLIRTAEGLRQGVAEARQLMAALRAHGCRDFALWATSYGGWIGVLLLSVEAGFRWAALMAPIVDVEHAIWQSPAGAALRRELRRVGITQADIEPHFRLISPLHSQPLDSASRIILCAGEHDRIAEAHSIAALHRAWPSSQYFTVPQGHFGYRMMRETWPRAMPELP